MALLAIVGVGVVLRAAWVAYAARPPQTLIDPTFYSLYAEQIADGNGYRLPSGEPTAYYPIGYPAALGAVVWLVQLLPVPYDLPMVAGWFNLVAGMATVVAVFELARRLLDDTRVGLVAAALVALWPNLVLHTAAALSETFFNLLLVLALLVLLGTPWPARPPWGRLVAFGVLLGASALVRPISLLVLPALLVVWGRSAGWGWKPAVGALAATSAAAVAVIAPWSVRNLVVLDSPVVISTNIGDNLCIGRHPGATGAFHLTDYCFAGFDGLERPEYELARNRETTRRALEHIRGHPLDEVPLLWRRAYHTMRDDHDALDAVESYGADVFIPKGWRSLLARVADLWFFAVLAVAALGIPRFRREADPRRAAFLWSMVAVAVPPLIFFGHPRFHVPVVPFLAVLAASAGVAMWTARRNGTPEPEPA